jgi:hypothetical protein
MLYYELVIKPDWDKRNKMVIRVQSTITFDDLVDIIVNNIGIDSGHLYELTIVKYGTTRKQQLERGNKIITEGSEMPYPKLFNNYDLPESERLAIRAREEKRIKKETHFTFEPLNSIKWNSGTKMWLLYDFGDMNYFSITCNNIVEGEYADEVSVRKHFIKYSDHEGPE